MSLSSIVPVKRKEEFLQRIADACEGISVKELPAHAAGDAGKVLTVSASGAAVEWDTPATGVPDYDSGDAGKILKVSSGGDSLEWASGGSGGGSGLCLSLSSTGVSLEIDGDTYTGYPVTDNSINFGVIAAALTAGGAIIIEASGISGHEDFETVTRCYMDNSVPSYQYCVASKTYTLFADGRTATLYYINMQN